ncbi:MAG: DNA photolyase, partial [Pseudomonadota bacterium]|nr:DNA photolyase [Pseudomonadota bacterium]
MTLYISAEQTLDSFLRKGIRNYTKSRNFDFGTENRGNVSRLSPFISHRLILEYDVIKNALALYPFEKIEKFIEEIFWGVYWRGWLEQRPSVWESFKNYPEPLKSDPAYA